MQQQVYGTLFRNINELKKRLVSTSLNSRLVFHLIQHLLLHYLGKVWSRTLSTLLSTNGECISLPVFAQMADISNIYCQQLHN